MKNTTQLTLNRPEQMIVDEAISYYLRNCKESGLNEEGILKLCTIRTKICANIGIIPNYSKEQYKSISQDIALRFLNQQEYDEVGKA